jgi:hypothetical protein
MKYRSEMPLPSLKRRRVKKHSGRTTVRFQTMRPSGRQSLIYIKKNKIKESARGRSLLCILSSSISSA